MNGEEDSKRTFLARFSSMQIAIVVMAGAVILVVLVIAAASIT
jgi:hypothetical protein